MGKADEEFMARLLATFQIEAGEHLQKIIDGLLLLEKGEEEENASLVEEVYREIHSLKGASRAVNLPDVESLCQSLEGVFSYLKKKQLQLATGDFDLAHNAVDLITAYLAAPDAARRDELRAVMSECKTELSALIYGNRNSFRDVPSAITNAPFEYGKAPSDSHRAPSLTSYDSSIPPAAEVEQKVPSPAVVHGKSADDTVRISGERLTRLLMQTEELLSVKLTTEQHVSAIEESLEKFCTIEKEWEKIQPDIKLLRQMQKSDDDFLQAKNRTAINKLINFLDWEHSHISEHEGRMSGLQRMFKKDRRNLSSMVDELLSDVKDITMIPVSSQFSIFPKIVRNLSSDLGKETDLEISGGSIEIDRRVLDEMKDAFIHILRNSLDHGIEKPDERLRAGKKRRALIKINVERGEGNTIAVDIEDDGRGIDNENIKKEAVRKNMISLEEASVLRDSEAAELLFKSGFSTSQVITDISGRGLGLAIVREKAEKLKGSVSIESSVGKGTKFTVRLPLTLVTLRGILLMSAGQLFVLPTSDVERIRRSARDEVKTVGNRETIMNNGIPVSLVKMRDVLRLPPSEDEDGVHIIAVIINQGGMRMAFAVDKVIGEQEILVKPFGSPLVRVKNISGATILGSGRIVPILNASDLIRSGEKQGGAAAKKTDEFSAAGMGPKSVLVADDSITSRMLIKDILETAGYNVKAAIDGVEALAALKMENFDAVVSDVEMPRMNGFELVRNIRANEKTADMPVVLVTALASKEDREKGADAGANAYLVKSDFEQSNLVEILKRLV